jgi:hypothetical protein
VQALALGQLFALGPAPAWAPASWEFDRAAKSTMESLATVYRGGATSLVENTFDAIRGARPKGSHLM